MPIATIDNRFATDEIMAATELQDTATAKLQERIARQHKLLLTHYNRPVGVLLDMETFQGLIARLRELEEYVEDLEATRLAENRLRESPADSQWLSQEELAESVKRLILETEVTGHEKA